MARKDVGRLTAGLGSVLAVLLCHSSVQAGGLLQRFGCHRAYLVPDCGDCFGFYATVWNPWPAMCPPGPPDTSAPVRTIVAPHTILPAPRPASPAEPGPTAIPPADARLPRLPALSPLRSVQHVEPAVPKPEPLVP